MKEVSKRVREGDERMEAKARETERKGDRFEDVTLLASMLEKRASSQGMQAASGKVKKMDSPLQPPEEM